MSKPARTSAFSILVISLIMMIIGAVLIPRLPVHLVSTRTLPSLTVSYNWPNASPRNVEQEVTAPLEGLLNTIRNLTSIESTSGTGRGSITLQFDKDSDMDAMRFEVASKIREIFPRLPANVSYPGISAYRQESDEKYLLTYTLNAPASPRLIQQYADESIKPRLSGIPGLYKIRIWGATPMEWELEYDQELLKQMGISRIQVAQALQIYFAREVIGMGYDNSNNFGSQAAKSVMIRTMMPDDHSWQEIPVARIGGRVFLVRDLCKIRYKEQEPTGYYRINGNNTINMVLIAEKDANSIRVADEIKKQLALLENDFPDGYRRARS